MPIVFFASNYFKKLPVSIFPILKKITERELWGFFRLNKNPFKKRRGNSGIK